MARRFAAAILMCAVMVLVAAVPLALAGTHEIVKGEKGPNASAVTWKYTPTDFGIWTGHIVNNGLRWVVVDVGDNTTGVVEEILHQRIRFAAYDAFPSGEVNTSGVIMSPSHDYEITITPNGPRGTSCTVEDMFKIPVPPVAKLSATVSHMDVSVDSAGSSDSDGIIVSYDWSFGDGGTATGPTATHTYAAPGPYTITLLVTDNDGLTGTESTVVNIVDNPPVASFTATVNGATVDFSAAGSGDDYGIVSYEWNFGDGTTGSGVSVTHTYSTPPVQGLASAASIGKARPPVFPYTVFGYTYQSDGVTKLPGCSVTITNTRTMESQTIPSDVDAYYSIDINQPTLYPSGYLNGDVIEVTAVYGTMSGSNSGVANDVASPFLWLDITLTGVGPVAHDYTVTLTVTDSIGQTSTMTKIVTAYW